MESSGCRTVAAFAQYLETEEKSKSTIAKYVRDVNKFFSYIGAGKSAKELVREWVLEYKEYLLKNYKPASANSMLVALNSYLKFAGRADCCVRTFRMQKQIFREADRELSCEEYRRLVRAAGRSGNERLCHILQTIGATGIRISELPFITVEALRRGTVSVQCKGKARVIVLPRSLILLLEKYCRDRGIEKGSIFVTIKGHPMDRRNVWREMKRLCAEAGVDAGKVFPHNLRHLFAKCYYEKERDLVRLADYLGHSSVETTRRYTMITSMEAYLKQLELELVVTRTGGAAM